MSYLTQPSTFTLPLAPKARKQAQFLHDLQANPRKARQVYLNTLAVWAVNAYLEALGFETNLDTSDSQDMIMVSLSDCADLVVSHLGKLECRPVLPDSETLYIPESVWQERVGYVAAQFDSEFRQATLLGFLPDVATETVLVRDLQSLDQFLEFLEVATQSTEIAPPTSTPLNDGHTNLSRWLQGVFEEGWQTVQDLFSNEFSNPAIALRQALKGASPISTNDFTAGKLLKLSLQLETPPLLLLIGVMPKEDNKVKVSVRLCSADDTVSLPAQIGLAITDRFEKELKSVQKPFEQDFIQLLPFTLRSGTPFAIRVSYGGVSITEQFTA